MRVLLKTVVVVLAVCVAHIECCAQPLPFGLVADGRVRAEYLFAQQTIRPFRSAEAAIVTGMATTADVFINPDHYQFVLDPRFPVIDAELELSAAIPVSVRGGSMVSMVKSTATHHRSLQYILAPPSSNSWDMNGNFVSWEVAGLYHLWRGGGYRFSFLAGYRREEWFNSGTAGAIGGSSMEDRFTSRIPFLGLQTSMVMPWWSARFEIIASPFMYKQAEGSWRGGALLVDYRGEAGQGGGVKIRVSGAARIAPAVSVGIDGQFSYHGVKGEMNATGDFVASGRRHTFDLEFRETYASVGATLQCGF